MPFLTDNRGELLFYRSKNEIYFVSMSYYFVIYTVFQSNKVVFRLYGLNAIYYNSRLSHRHIGVGADGTDRDIVYTAYVE